VPGAAYKKGDVIGQKYEVYDVLGKGGFGIVYLVYSQQTGLVYALKTFQDKFLSDALRRERFRKEASVWVDLERHPYLVKAHWVDEVAGRLFIAMEHIAPGEDGLNTLEGYLQHRPPDLAQSLRWAIQFCYGMEYAYSRGIRCHRDIKPSNIMVSQDKTVKITDFGLAGVLVPAQAMSGIRSSVQQGRIRDSHPISERCHKARHSGISDCRLQIVDWPRVRHRMVGLVETMMIADSLQLTAHGQQTPGDTIGDS
jgi:serine/threonine protein kinase